MSANPTQSHPRPLTKQLTKQHCPLSQYTAGYLDTGGSGPVLLFLHGFFGSSTNWQPLIAALSDRYRCIALDLLGFGDSSKPWLKYTVWHQVDFLTEFMAQLGLTQVTLIGHSYGGWTAAAYAVRQAQDSSVRDRTASLTALALIAPAGIRDDSFVGRYNYMKPLLWESPLVDWAIGLLKPICQLVKQPKFYQQIAEARQALTEQPVAKSFLVDRLRPEDAIDTVENDIAAIPVPTLVIAAEQDSTIPLWHCQTYADRIPNAQIIVLPDAEHGLIQTHVEDIAIAIRDLPQQPTHISLL